MADFVNKSGVWTRESYANLAIRTQPESIAMAYHRQQRPTKAQTDQAILAKREAEKTLALKMKQLQQRKNKLLTGESTPAIHLDRVQKSLQAFSDIQLFCETSHASLRTQKEDLEADQVKSTAIEKELRQQIRDLKEEHAKATRGHATELAGFVSMEDYNQIQEQARQAAEARGMQISEKDLEIKQLKAELQEQKQLTTTANEEKSKGALEIARLNTEHTRIRGQANTEVFNLNNQKRTAESQRDQLQRRLDDNTMEWSRREDFLNSQIASHKRSHEQQVATLTSQKDETIDSLKAHIRTLEIEATKQSTASTDLNNRFDIMSGDLNTAKSTNAANASKIKELDGRIAALVGEKTKLSNEVTSLENKLELSEGCEKQLEGDLQKTKQELRELKDKINQNENHAANLQTLQGQWNKLDEEHTQLKQQLKSQTIEHQNDLLEVKNANLEAATQKATEHNQAIDKAHQDLKSEWADHQTTTTRLQQEANKVKRLQEQLDSAREEAREATTKHDELQSLLNTANHNLKTSQSQNEVDGREISRMRETYGHLQEELDKAGDDLDTLKQSRDAMENEKDGELERQRKAIGRLQELYRLANAHSEGIVKTWTALSNALNQACVAASMASSGRADLKVANASLASALEESSQHRDHYAEEAEQLRQELDAAVNEHEDNLLEVQNELDWANDAKGEAEEKLRQLEIAKKDVDSNLRQATEDIERLTGERTRLTEQHTKVKKELGQLRTDLESKTTDLNTTQKQVGEKQATLNKLNADSKKARKLETKLYNEITELRGERTEVISSRRSLKEQLEKEIEDLNEAVKHLQVVEAKHKRLEKTVLPKYEDAIFHFGNASESRLLKLSKILEDMSITETNGMSPAKRVEHERIVLDRLIQEHENEIQWCHERLTKWDEKLKAMRDRYVAFRNDTNAFIEQNANQRDVVLADAIALITWLNDKLFAGVDEPLPELQSSAHEAFQSPLSRP